MTDYNGDNWGRRSCSNTVILMGTVTAMQLRMLYTQHSSAHGVHPFSPVTIRGRDALVCWGWALLHEGGQQLCDTREEYAAETSRDAVCVPTAPPPHRKDFVLCRQKPKQLVVEDVATRTQHLSVLHCMGYLTRLRVGIMNRSHIKHTRIDPRPAPLRSPQTNSRQICHRLGSWMLGRRLRGLAL